MTPSDQRIDFAFGLSQLSGNKTLYLSLLKRFSDEYRDIDDKVQKLLKSNDIESVVRFFHTLKGVSANLGMPALQAQCKTVELSLKASQTLPDNYATLTATLNATLDDIDAFENANNPELTSPASSAVNAGDPNARTRLQRALEAMEYIPDASLTAWLDEGNFTDPQRTALIQAVTELDYTEALRILKS